jgi:DNA-binding NarL/FixJ family response regulator
MKTLRVLLVDDHEVVRLGLGALLQAQPDTQIVAEASSAEEAVRQVERHRPDLVLMDIRLPGESGITACRTITARWPETKVIMLTSFADDDLIFQAIQAGAAGYVLKQVGNDELLRAIEAVREGEALLDPSVTRKVIERVRQRERAADSAAFRDLTERELEVLALLAEGKTNVEIAAALTLSEKTVRNHVSVILEKLGVANRIEAATYAVRHDIKRLLRGME